MTDAVMTGLVETCGRVGSQFDTVALHWTLGYPAVLVSPSTYQPTSGEQTEKYNNYFINLPRSLINFSTTQNLKWIWIN